MRKDSRSTSIIAAAIAAALCSQRSAVAGLGFNVDAGTFGGDTGRYNAAVAAMTNVTNRYNVYGDFGNYNIYAYYNSGIPTAQANYLGAIGFGGTYPNDRVTQHESNHYLGSGTIDAWYNSFDQYGGWTGAKVSQLYQQFEGDGTRMYRAGVHFYGYGLNYDSEVNSDAVLMRNVALMYAMRQDMGNGNQASPWSATSVTLSASDPAGTSAFNWFGGGYSGTYVGWSDKYFAHAGAAYSTGAFDIRTPQGYPSWTFAGDSLTVNAGGRLLFNGYGTDGQVKINDLRLAGGTLRHDQFSQDLFQLAGNITLTNAPVIDAANGPIRILSTISGTGSLNTQGSYTTTLTGTNTYSGGTNVLAGTLAIAAGGAAGGIRGTLNINSGATVKLTAADALGFGVGSSVTQINITGGVLDNAIGANNAYLASWNLTGGQMTSTGGGAFHINALAGKTITSNASATPSVISGNVAIRGANSTLSINVADGASANDLIIGGAITNSPFEAGANGIAKSGAGTLVLSGANTFTGATAVNAGTLAFASAQSNIGAVTVANSAGLRVGATGINTTTLVSTSLTLGTGGGSTTLTFDMAGLDTTAPLITTGSLSVLGTANVTILNGGALSNGSHPLIGYTSFAGGGTISPTTLTLGTRSSATLTNNGTTSVFLNVTADRPIWTGRDNGNWAANLNGTLKNWKLQSNSTATDYLETDNVIFDDTVTGSTAVSISAANVSPVAVTFNNASKSYTLSSPNGYGIAGTTGLTKNGAGSLTISTANTFTGPVTLNGGTTYASMSVNPANNAVFSYTSGIAVNSGATLKAGNNSLFGYSGADDKPIVVNTGGILTTDAGGDVGVGLVTLNGGTMTTGGANTGNGTWRFQDASSRLYVTADSTVSGANYKFQNSAPIDVAPAKTLSFTGTITDTTNFGASSLIKNGLGTLTLSANNTYSGGTTINAGVTSISSDVNIGSDGSAISINGGTLKTTAFVYNTHPITIGAAGGTINVTTSGQYFFNVGNLLRGTGPLTLTGNGTLTANVGNLRLNQSNSYSGTLTTRDGGILEYGTGSAVGGGAALVIGNQGEISVNDGVTLPNSIAINGGTNSVLSFENGNNGNYSGAIALNANAIVGLRDWYNNAATRNGSISGSISGIGSLTVNSGTGAGGVLTLTGYNSFSGDLNVDKATVVANAGNNAYSPTASVLGNPQAARSMNVNNGATLQFANGDSLGSADTSVVATLVINAGGTVTNANSSFTTLGPVQLNGGTLTGTGGAVAGYQMYNLRATVTVGGASASTISGSGTNAGYHLAAPTTFNVADVTTGTDLLVSGSLIDQDQTHGGAGTLRKTGLGTMELSGANTYTGGTLVQGGTLVVSNPAGLGIGSLTVGAGATVNIAASTSGAVKVKSLSIAGTSAAPTAKVDLSTRGLIIDYSGAVGTQMSDVRALVKVGRGQPNASGVFEYAAQGLTSSAIAGANLLAGFNKFAIGAINNSDLAVANRYTTFGGTIVDADSILIRYTYNGDADLDGAITSKDYALINASITAGGTAPNGWLSGDFTLDGIVNADDLAVIDFGYLAQGTALGIDPVAVPEPASAIVIAVAFGAGLRRRRRHLPLHSHASIR